MNQFFICLPAIIVFLIAFGLIYLIVKRKKILINFPNKEMESIKQKAIQTFQKQGFKIKEKNDKIYIEKDTFTATTLYFKQNSTQVDVFKIHAASTTAWILIIIFAFLFLIGALVIGVIIDSNSTSFTKDTILPLLKAQVYGEHRCAKCGRIMPFDANNCAYCGGQPKSFK